MSAMLGPCPAHSLFGSKLFYMLTIKQQLNWSISLSVPASTMHIFMSGWPRATGISQFAIKLSSCNSLPEVTCRYLWEEDEIGGVLICLVMLLQFFTGWTQDLRVVFINLWINHDWCIKSFYSFRLKTAGVLCFYLRIHLQHLSGSLGFSGLFGTDVEMISSVMCDQIALPYEIYIL